MPDSYDVVIIGSGPAGLSAGIYAGRAGLNSLMIEKDKGGLIASTFAVENYPGATENISGAMLSERMRQQALSSGCQIMLGEATSIEKKPNGYFETTLVETTLASNKKVLQSISVIAATGTTPRLLGVPGELEYRGRGVSYCATCDAFFFRGKEVVVIGGGDSALQEARYLAKIASKVTIVHRRDEFRATKAEVNATRAIGDKIGFLLNCIPVEIYGSSIVQGVKVQNTQTGEFVDVACDGVFIYAGLVPQNSIFRGLVDLDDGGYIVAGENTHTSLEGMFAAGDARTTLLRQVVTACADGAISALQAMAYINEFVKSNS